MNFISAHSLTMDRQRKKLWQAEGVAYLLAVLAHVGAWQLYKILPPQTLEPEPLIIEASLVVAQPAPTAVAPAPPQPVVKPPPIPKPVPKVEKPIPKKVEKPKPKPIPMPKPMPKLAPKPIAKPEPSEEDDSSPAPVVHEPVDEAPSAPTEAPRAAPKAPPAPVENTAYSPGRVSGFGRNNYPRAAKERGWEGTVTLKVHILADGDIGEVIVTSSSGHDMLDEAAMDMVKEGHATPARRGDKPVDSWVVVPYRFHLEHD
ncbi:MAG: energy transducer TonB [Candidatus Methylumidiphilus alinenensis]|uniref:Protein TonB n=1 Tax=Candidatus Methylumidiphilus alinenensis TaxID=2202197 RepID=A0A2W4QCR3_9GAMM|nr:MAG: energy transducer TonB [Candidatus Methylumidiphilus alinenensis]